MENKWHIIRARSYAAVRDGKEDGEECTTIRGQVVDIVRITVACLRALHDKADWDTLPVIQALRDEVARQAYADISAEAEK